MGIIQERTLSLKILVLCFFTQHICVMSTSNNPGESKGPPGPPWRVLFFGSDDFSLRTLVRLTDEFKESKKLISNLELMFVDDETVVWKHAYEHRLPRVAYPPETGEELRGKYDIGILVSFGELLQDDVIREFPLGIFNAHPSLLPRWRGVSPIPHAIMHGDNETGVSVIKMKPNDEFDSGDVVRQTRIKLEPHEHTPELHERLAKETADLVMSVLKDLPKSIQEPVPQKNESATYAPMLVQEMSWIVWQNMSSEDIYNRHRAISHIWPVATIWKCYVVKFHDIKINEGPSISPFSSDGVTTPATGSQTKTGLHNLQANPDRTGFRRKGKEERTKRPRRITSAPLDGEKTAPTADPDYKEDTEIPWATDTHETVRQKRARYVSETYLWPTPRGDIGPDYWLKPGLVMYDKDLKCLRVMCRDGVQILVPRVSVQRRKTMNALSFHNGFLSRTKPEDRIFSEYSHFKGADATKSPWA